MNSSGCVQLLLCHFLGFFVYHSFKHRGGIASDDTVPHATAFIRMSVILLKTSSVHNEGTDATMACSGRIFFCFIPCAKCSNVFVKNASVRSCIMKVLQRGALSKLQYSHYNFSFTINVRNMQLMSRPWELKENTA